MMLYKIQELAKNLPNDQEFGTEVRKLLNSEEETDYETLTANIFKLYEQVVGEHNRIHKDVDDLRNQINRENEE